MSFTFLLLLLFSHHICASQDSPSEEITYLHADIYVNTDCSITVQETIEVCSLGKYIKYGIYRKFPKSYVFTDVQKDGASVPYSVTQLRGKRESNYQELYIGDKNIKLNPGIHTYTITYTVKKAVYPLFNMTTNEHIQDFITWDIKGNNHGFLIKNIATTIHLPAQQSPNHYATFTLFSNLTSAMIDDSIPNKLIFHSTSPIKKEKDVKITAIWQKGFVNLTQFDRNIYECILLLSKLSIPAAIIIIIFNLLRLYTRRKRLYIPKYAFLENPPNNILPEEASYIFYGHLTIEGVVATLIDMAQKGYLIIEKTSNDIYVITKKQTTDHTIIYHIIAEILFKNGNASPLYKKEKELMKITKIMKQYCKDKQHFEKESPFIIIPLIISGILFILMLLLILFNPSPQIWPHTQYNHYILLFTTAFISGICSLFLNQIPTNEGLTIIKHLEQFKLFLIVQPEFYTTSIEKQQKAQLFEQNFPYAIALDAARKWSEYVPKNGSRNNSITDIHLILYFLLPHLVPLYEREKYYQRKRRRIKKIGIL